ncbi:MAG: hypothetical protein WAZ18_02890 [Alphaproteobacteria bacterium]
MEAFPELSSKAGGGGHGGGNGAIVIMLALFLIMLVLFILLNSYATTSNQKAASAVKGITERLEIPEYAVQSRGLSATMDGIPWNMAVQTRLSGVMNNQLQIATPDIETDATTVKVTLPVSTFFEGDGADVKPSVLGFLENLGPVLKGDAAGAPALTVMVMADAQALPLAMARAYALVQPILTHGGQGVVAAAGSGVAGQNSAVLAFAYREGDVAAQGNVSKVDENLKPLGGTLRGEGR